MKIKTKIKGFNIETNIEDCFTEKVTKFGTGAKINASKKLIGKKVIIFIPKS